MIHSIAIAALLLAPALATKAPCVPRDGVRDAVMVMAPHLIEAVADHCRAHLPAEAFLAAGSAALVTRLKAESAGRAGSAAAALTAVAGEKLPPIKDSEALLIVGGQLGGAELAKEIKPDMCPEMNNLVEAVAPLPLENVGRALASILVLAKVGEKGSGPAICKHG